MGREVVLSAVMVLILAFMCWLHACGRWKQRREEELAGQSMDILIAEVDDHERAAEEAAAAARKGLDKAALEALPTFVYRRSAEEDAIKNHSEELAAKRGRQMVECPVCLSEFQEEERGRLLPNCRHRFHVDCIDTWLLANVTCPVCRTSCAAAAEDVQELQQAASVQYPTNVLFWGSNVSVLAVTSGGSLQQSTPIQIITQAPIPLPPESAPPSSSTSSRISRLKRLLSTERIHTPIPLYTKV